MNWWYDSNNRAPAFQALSLSSNPVSPKKRKGCEKIYNHANKTKLELHWYQTSTFKNKEYCQGMEVIS
jgi:hypothetical protein